MPRRLAREWRRWLIENLLLGTKPRVLERTLVKAGLTIARARAEIDAVVGDPAFRGAYRAVAMQRKLEGLLDAFGDLHRQQPAPGEVERPGALGPQELIERYLLRSRPVIARGAFAPLVSSGALTLRQPALWRAGLRSSPMRRAGADLLVYQVLGARELTLAPWWGFPSLAGRTRASEARPFRLPVALSAGELLFIPVGWWYRLHGGATGAAVCYRAADARGGEITWRETAAVPATATPRLRPGP
jgi:hypothetical protein